MQRIDGLSRELKGAAAGLEAMITETGAIKDAVLRSRAPEALRNRARALELELLDMQQRLQGNQTRDLYGDIGPVSVSRRLQVATLGTFRSTYGPTPTHLQSVEIAEAQFAGIRERLQAINENDLPALRRDLDEAGVPWTPGRAVPGRG